MFNGASAYSIGNGACMDSAVVASLPWVLRVGVPGMVGGWPA